MNNGHHEVRTCGSCGEILADNEHYWCGDCISYHGWYIYARWLEDFATKRERTVEHQEAEIDALCSLLNKPQPVVEEYEREDFPLFRF